MTLSSPLTFTDNSTLLNAATLNKLKTRSQVNLLKCPNFESWLAGDGDPTPSATTIPDGWEFEYGGATGAKMRKHKTIYITGTGAADIMKYTTDAGPGYSTLDQNVHGLFEQDAWSDQYITFSAWVYCQKASHARLYLYDGSTLDYTEYHGGGSAWEFMSFEYQLPSSPGPTALRIGLHCVNSASFDIQTLIDQACLTIGRVTPDPAPQLVDECAQCYEWDNDGTRTRISGGVRLVPFTWDTAHAGGSATETESYTLDHGCVQIFYADAQAYSLTGGSEHLMKCDCNNYSATGFDIVASMTDGSNIPASASVVFKGFYLCGGWDDPEEVHGDW